MERKELYFGEFPPEYYGGDDDMRKPDTTFMVLLVLGLVLIMFGIVLLFLPHPIPTWRGETWLVLTDSIGVAFVVAGILAITVDWRLKKAILDDVVKASLGYTLPDSLRPAMRWIYGQKFVCERHTQFVELIPDANNPLALLVKTEIQRKITNISNAPQRIRIGVDIDELFIDRTESDIVAAGYRYANQTVDMLPGKERHKYGWRTKKQEVKLGKGDSIDTWLITHEVRRLNDASLWVFRHATQEPQITVKFPDTLVYEVGGVTDEADETPESRGPNVWVLPVTLLPMHGINIRWREKSKVEKWLREDK